MTLKTLGAACWPSIYTCNGNEWNSSQSVLYTVVHKLTSGWPSTWVTSGSAFWLPFPSWTSEISKERGASTYFMRASDNWRPRQVHHWAYCSVAWMLLVQWMPNPIDGLDYPPRWIQCPQHLPFSTQMTMFSWPTMMATRWYAPLLHSLVTALTVSIKLIGHAVGYTSVMHLPFIERCSIHSKDAFMTLATW